MRLSEYERDVISMTGKQIFGPGASLILFGSRANDSARGGDIDLLIIPDESSYNNLFTLKIQFLVELKNILGDQKIDVIIQKKNDNRLIITTAKQKGIVLC